MTENADWQSGWQLTDEIIESQDSSEEIWYDVEDTPTDD
jgi:hypothetical protein